MTETAEEIRLRNLERRVDVVETKVDDMREDIKEIRSGQSKLLYAIMAALGTGVITLGVAIIGLLKAGG